MVVQDFHPFLSGLTGENLLLVMAVILEPDARAAGVGVAHELVVVTEGLHVDAPFMPQIRNVQAFLQKTQGKFFVVVGAHQTLTQFFQDYADIFAVLLRVIAGEVVVARCPGAGAAGVGLFRNQGFRAFARRGDGRAQAADAAADNKNVRGDGSIEFQHDGLLEPFAIESICRPDTVFRPAGFTPSPEPDAASELRLLRRRGFSLASLDSGSIFKTKML